jgi:REP element-mobilizing transposase RayT
MAHSFVRILVHAVWSTKSREKLIHPNVERDIHKILYSKFEENQSPVLALNGTTDHIHVLFLMNHKKALDETIKIIKGGSTYEINNQKLSNEKFSWQTGFGAFSVSEQNKDTVIQYIRNQKQRHKTQTLEQEMDWIKKNLDY